MTSSVILTPIFPLTYILRLADNKGMTGGNLGVQLGQLVFEATMESVGEVALLTGEDAAKALIEYLTLMQFSASRRVAILFSDARIDSVLDDIRRAGADLLEDEGLALNRGKIEKFQNERYGQYYAAMRQDGASYPSEVLARTFLSRCVPCAVSSGRFDQGDVAEHDRAAQDISNQLEQLDYRIDIFVLGFMGNRPHDESTSPSAGSGQALPVKVDVHRRDSPERDILVELIASDLQKDLNDLSQLSRTLCRGVSIAGAGGLAFAGYEAFMGDWLTTLTVGVMLLLVGGLANRHKRLRIARMRQKWTSRFSRLDADQLSAFLSELNTKHPLLLARLGF